jgi:hypothetical protein
VVVDDVGEDVEAAGVAARTKRLRASGRRSGLDGEGIGRIIAPAAAAGNSLTGMSWMAVKPRSRR